jgi:DNA polymerase-3 subunit epsilon
MYAIVDIETTGGHASANGITEIAICIHNGKKVIERYETLVNPQRDIPIYIRALTGISNEMVSTAPLFEDVAHDIYHLLNGKIFVAHNVNFDHSFVRYHLGLAGYDLQCNKLCTVRLSRKIMPGLLSYSLGKLCHHLGIENNSRHRAMGDADATADQVLPPNLPKADIDKLPMMPGVYYFHDNKGKVIYVGKAKNIRKRVCSHFSGNNSGLQRQEFMRNIYNVSFQECGTELIAFVLEAVEIKRLWPKYNRSLKRFEQGYALYDYIDQRGYVRLAVDKHHKFQVPIYTCNSLFEGYTLLNKLIENFELCPKLCFIQKNNSECNGVHKGDCACTRTMLPDEYNEKVNSAISSLNDALPTFAIRDEGRSSDEHSCILIEKGRFYGMGYISHYFNVGTDVQQLKQHLTPYPGNDYIRNMITGYAMKFPERMHVFA